MQVPHLSDCCTFKKELAAGEYKFSNVLFWFSLELGFGEGDKVVLLSLFELLNKCKNLLLNWDDAEVTN